MDIVPPELAVSVTATVEPEVTPVAVIAAPETFQTCVLVPLTLHLIPSVTTVPFGITKVVSKVKVVSVAVVESALGTLLPVLSAVEPLKSWQEVSSVMTPVCVRGIEDIRMSSPDCDASSWTWPKSTLWPPETMVCDAGWEDITTVSEAALIVIVFIEKDAGVRVIVLPEVWPVTPVQLVCTVVTITVELLATPEGILPLMV